MLLGKLGFKNPLEPLWGKGKEYDVGMRFDLSCFQELQLS